MKNRKIISFICAIAMIMSVFAGFTTVSAAGTKGITLEATLNDDATELTVVAKAVGLDADGVKSTLLAFNVPDFVTKADVSYTSFYDDGSVATAWAAPNVTTKHVLKMFFGDTQTGAKHNFKDNILATITIKLSQPLETDYTVTLDDEATLQDTSEASVGTGPNDMEKTSSIAKNPSAKTQKPGNKPEKVEPPADSDPEPVLPDANKKGIKLDASLSDDNMTLTVVATAVNLDAEGVKSALIAFNVPEDITKADVSYTSFYDDGSAATAWAAPNVTTKHVLKMFFGDTQTGAKHNFKDNILATITIKLHTPITTATAITLDDEATLQDTSEAGVGTGPNDMTKTSAVAKPNEAKRDSTTVDLEDYMGVDKANGNKTAAEVAKEAESDEHKDEYGDLWIDVQITKDNGSGGREPAKYGDDFVAWFDMDGDGTKEKLTETQYKNLVSGNTDKKMSEVIEGLQFEVYDSAKGVKIETELYAEQKPTSLLNKNENQDVNQGPPPTYSKPTMSVSPTSKTAYVGDDVSIKFSYDAKDYAAKDGKITLNVPSDILDSAAASGVKVSYTAAADNKETTPKALVSGEFDGEKVITDMAAKGSVTVTFKAALKTSKALEITAEYEGANEKKETANKSATSKITIKEKGTNDNDNDSSSSSSSTSSSGKGTGVIASGNQSGNASGYIGAFTDMAGYDWAQQAVTALSLKHIISGRGDGTFDPAGQITRAEYAQMLINAIGKSSDYADTTFNDVPTDSWFYHNVAVAAQLGIVSGYGDGNFGPYDLITREQMALMTQKAAVVMNKALVGSIAASFTDDADIADWSKAAVYELANAGIINGMGDGTFAPKANATRAQAAVIIFNTFVK